MSLYPSLAVPTISDEKLSESETTPQTFRLQKIGELETFFRSEVGFRSALFKKYSRAVNMVNGASATCALFRLSAGAGGATLLATGVRLVPGIILNLLLCCPVCSMSLESPLFSRRFSAKAAKHEAIRVLASSKLNTIHSHVIKALEDDFVSEEEYKLILEEIKKYRVMKDEIRNKSVGIAVSEDPKKS